MNAMKNNNHMLLKENSAHSCQKSCENDCQKPKDLLFDETPASEMSNKQLGAEGEKLAASYLEKRGLKIIGTNWTCSFGEVDIIAYSPEEKCHVLVEVKTRYSAANDDTSIPELAVDARKQAKYRKLGLLYLAEHDEVRDIRFDVIAITIMDDHVAKLRHLIGAFWWDE